MTLKLQLCDKILQNSRMFILRIKLNTHDDIDPVTESKRGMEKSIEDSLDMEL